jgi:hypothetical protein
MERTREMGQTQRFQKDPELQQEMERFRSHWRGLLDNMEQGIGLMKRIQKRMYT